MPEYFTSARFHFTPGIFFLLFLQNISSICVVTSWAHLQKFNPSKTVEYIRLICKYWKRFFSKECLEVLSLNYYWTHTHTLANKRIKNFKQKYCITPADLVMHTEVINVNKICELGSSMNQQWTPIPSSSILVRGYIYIKSY